MKVLRQMLMESKSFIKEDGKVKSDEKILDVKECKGCTYNKPSKGLVCGYSSYKKLFNKCQRDDKNLLLRWGS